MLPEQHSIDELMRGGLGLHELDGEETRSTHSLIGTLGILEGARDSGDPQIQRRVIEATERAIAPDALHGDAWEVLRVRDVVGEAIESVKDKLPLSKTP